jgi:hypothetical protein
MGLTLVLIFLSQEFWQSLPDLIRNPVAMIALVMLIFLALGTQYSSATDHENINYLWRYKKLLLVPLCIPFFQESKFRYQALSCFSAATFLTVLVSWSEFFKFTHLSDPAFGDFTGDSVFVMHITQGYLFAMLISLAVALSLASKNTYLKAAWLCMGAITALDICFVMWGKTGKATLIVLFLWGSMEWLNIQPWKFKTKAIIQMICICSVILGIAIAAKNPTNSFGMIRSDLEKAQTTGEATSQGLRQQFAKTGIKIFLKSPWIGHGTGSIVSQQTLFAKEAGTPVGEVITVNLHNEYLMQAVQLGVMGIALFLSWIAYTWFYSLRQLPEWQSIALRGVIVVFAFGCLFNSYLWDHIEGYTYCLLLATLVPIKHTRSPQ